MFTDRANFGGAVNRSVRIEAQIKAENSKVAKKKKCLTQQRGKSQINFDKAPKTVEQITEMRR